MTTEYPEHLLERPTPEVFHEFAQIQRRAEADPLESGYQVDWTGPQLEDGTLPPTDYPHSRSPSPNPLRPFHSILVDPQVGPSASPWRLALVEALQSGVDQWSQVWRARATAGGNNAQAFPVVLKLYHQALFPPPELQDSRPEYDSWNWVSATYKQEREALVYRCARDSQGSDIPICYGFYRFSLPSGGEVVGVVLEDLVEVGRGISLREFLFREARANRMSAEHFNIIACEALQMQNRFHVLGLAETSCYMDNFLYLRASSSSSSVTLIGIGFGKSMSKERNLLSFAADYKERGLSDDFWCQDEQYRLFMALKRSLWEWESDIGKHNVAVEWADNEDEKETLTFLKRPWC
ncbi:hypothetical protein JCM3765_002980 [Sporobolomyces pararoseus]